MASCTECDPLRSNGGEDHGKALGDGKRPSRSGCWPVRRSCLQLPRGVWTPSRVGVSGHISVRSAAMTGPGCVGGLVPSARSAASPAHLRRFPLRRDASRDAPTASRAGPTGSRAGPMTSLGGPMRSRAGPMASRTGPTTSRDGPMGSLDGPMGSRDEPMRVRNGPERAGKRGGGVFGSQTRFFGAGPRGLPPVPANICSIHG